jgi:hypothetical protein
VLLEKYMKKLMKGAGMVMHTCNPSTQETGRRIGSSKPDWAT